MTAPALAPMLPTNRLMGHARDLEDPLGFFLRARAQGDVVRARVGPASVTLLFHPDHARHVLVDRADNYRKQTTGYARLRLMLGDGLVTSEGDLWRRQRRIANPAFRRACVHGFAGVMARAADERGDLWAEAAAAGRALDVSEEMNRLTLRIAGETLLGQDLSDASNTIGGALDEVMAWYADHISSAIPLFERLPTPTNLRFRRALRELDSVVLEIIAERRAEIAAGAAPRPDLLGMFMASVDDETGEGMSDTQLRDEVLTMLLAGHETTANALSWALYLLAKHPPAARRLEAELDDVLGGRLPEVADLRRLVYTDQVVREALRLYPPVWALGRRAVEDDTIGGAHIPAGHFVYLSPWVTHRHPGFWLDPEGFDPERFADGGPRGADGQKLPRLAWFPFSGGQRKCIGDRFAMMEAVILLATLLQRHRLALEPGHPVEPEAGLTLRPRYGLRMVPRSR